MNKLLFLLLFTILGYTINAQEHTLQDQQGDAVNSQELINNGKAKVFIFWANYCKYCKVEMKGVRNIGADWYEDYDAEIIFVSLENYPTDAYGKLEFLNDFEQEGVYYLHDQNMQFFNSYGFVSIPFTLLYDKEGNLIKEWNSYDDGLEKSLEMYLEKLYTSN